MTDVLDTPRDERAAAPEADAPSARATLVPREVWRQARLPVALGLALILVALLHALATGGSTIGLLDPDAADSGGGRAVAELLRDRGVDVRRVDAPSGAANTTVFFPIPDLAEALRPGTLDAARGAREVVVAAPSQPVLQALDVEAAVSGDVDEQVIEPACGQPDAVAAGAVRMGGLTFGAPEDAIPCYADRGQATFVDVAEGPRRVTLLGTGSFMTNRHLDDDGNAALALRLLSRHPTVEWVYPRVPSFAGESEEREGGGLFGLLPDRVFVVTAQAFVVLLLLALWRGRRLGPVVVEPLPVVVRAAEAVEGRARLYEGAHARGQAANALRAGLRDRLVRVLGLAPDADAETMVAAVTARTGRDVPSVGTLLYGPPPADDDALVRLAAELDRLDNEVRAL